MKSLAFVDWFSGCGLFRLGLERAGHRCVWSCEIDDDARSVYADRFGAAPEGKDIRGVTPQDVPDAELWVGGFPCQDLSSAGLGLGFEGGERSVLVFDLLKLAAERRPRWLLLENVPRILSLHGGRDFGLLLAAVEDAGYVGSWRVLDARWFGVPQRRRRLFLLARRAGDGVSPEAVLLDPTCRRGNPSPRRAKGTSPARGAHEGAEVAGPIGCTTPRGGTRAEPWDGGGALVADTVTAKWAKGTGGPAGDEVQNLAPVASTGHHRYSSPRGDASDNLVVPAVAATLTSGGTPTGSPPGRRTEDIDNLIAFDLAQVSHPENRAACRPGAFGGAQGGTLVGVVPISPDAAKGRDGDALTPSADATGRVRFRDPGLGVGEDGDASFTVGAHATPAVAVSQTSPPVRASVAKGHTNGEAASEAFLAAAEVRRLTPTECERLQGAPDGWTAGYPDSIRYRLLGNAVAVPVVAWIGRRLGEALGLPLVTQEGGASR